ncbi:MAG: esterase family protein [Acidobacteria bacterium]|nr:esterase family protein [Acidobacteriota bacterium]
MHREYVKWHSPVLGRGMELLVFGHAGAPLLVFPTSMGRFFDYEERGMIEAVNHKYGAGQLQAFRVDSVDAESWYNKAVHPRDRAARHAQYDRFLVDEVIPFIRARNPERPVATGCSFGGYHCVNFSLRHPELVAGCVSMGGAFDIHQFLDGYYDDNCYFNCPPDFLPNLHDESYLGRYRNGMKLVLATGERDICLEENLRLSRLLAEKQIPHWLDVWGGETGHDWPWWRRMAAKFF